MKKIHILPTDKPSRLGKFIDTNNLFLRTSNDIPRGENVYIYITSDEEIKIGDWWIDLLEKRIFWVTAEDIIVTKADGIPHNEFKKIILTTDQDLIKDGVQAIPDEFLEWFVKNPSFEEVETIVEYKDGYGNWFKYDKEFWDKMGNKPKFGTRYKIIIPKEEPKQETLEEFINKSNTPEGLDQFSYDKGLEDGSKWQQERMYSEEDMYKFANFCRTYDEDCLLKNTIDVKNTLELLEQFKKEDKQ